MFTSSHHILPQMSYTRHHRRSSSRQRGSFSTRAESVSSTRLDENDSEIFSGAASEVIPSSFSNFHHHIPSPSLRRTSHDSTVFEDQGHLAEHLNDSSASLADLQERSQFRFFTPQEIENAQGSSTVEFSENTDHAVDYDTNWNSYQDDYNVPARGRSDSMSRASLSRSSSFLSHLQRRREHSVNARDHSPDPEDYVERYNDEENDESESQDDFPIKGKTGARHHNLHYPDFPAQLHYQRFYIAEQDLVVGIAGYTSTLWKQILYYIICILTLGLAYLFLRWLPRYRIMFRGDRSPLGSCEWCVIETEFGQLEIIDINREWYDRPMSNFLPKNIDQHSEDKWRDEDIDPVIPVMIWFEYRYMKFFYSPVEDLFKTNCNWCDPAWENMHKAREGLSQETHEDRLMIFGRNVIDIKEKSTMQLLTDEVFHPFYVFQIFSIVLWLMDDYYYYASCIFLISVVSVVNTLVETKQTLHRLNEISRFECTVRVWRNEFWKEVGSGELVAGDIYEVSDPSLNTVPCDSILLSGDCIVNESMLTGESVPVSKLPMHQETAAMLGDEFRKTKISPTLVRSFLYCGTRIIRARQTSASEPALALVVKTGFNTTKGSLVRSMLFPKPTRFKFYQDSFKYIGVMTLIAMIGFVFSAVNFVKLGLPTRIIVLRALDIITIVVPPSLPATLTIGTSFALFRLKKSNIFCTAPTRVNIGGKLDVMCFDKTGTLTEEGLDIFGLQTSRRSGKDSFFNELTTQAERSSLFLTMLTCHSLNFVDGEIIGDPLDVKMFDSTGWLLIEDEHDTDLAEFNHSCPSHNLKPLLLRNQDSTFFQVKQFEFVSQLRRMSVVSASPEEEFSVFCKGAPEVLAEICVPESLPANYTHLLHYYTHNGYRVIACASKRITPSKPLGPFMEKLTREECERDLEFSGFIIFENKLKSSTKATIAKLNEAHLRTVMCTGDNILTAIHVAKECAMIPKGSQVFIPVFNDFNSVSWIEADDSSLELDPVTLNSPTSRETILAVTGDVFKYILTEHAENTLLIEKMLLYGRVFARMSPDEKHELVERLQGLDYTTGFCGDGANDAGALSVADVGISLSEAEASVAAPFTSRVFEISCVLDVIKEGRAALVTSFSCFQYMSLYSAIQFISVSILYKRGSNLGDFQFLYIDLFLILPIAVFMSWSRPFPQLCCQRPVANLISPKVLVPLICSIALLLAFQVMVWLDVQKQPWYVKPIPGGDDAVESSDNTVLFFFSNFQYILIAIVLAAGPPYREKIVKNVAFIVNVAVAGFVSALLMTVPPESWLGKLMNLTDISTGFILLILVSALANLVFLQAGRKWVFVWLARMYKKVWGRRESKKKFKRLQKEFSKVVV